MKYTQSSSASRSQILVVSHPDQYLEVFAERHVHVRVVRMPVTSTSAAAISAEDYVEQALPTNWRHLYLPGMLRATETLRPLSLETLIEAAWTESLIRQLNNRGEKNCNPLQERRTWML